MHAQAQGSSDDGSQGGGVAFRVCLGDAERSEFVDPVKVLRAATYSQAVSMLDEAEAALAAGCWIAGYLNYALGVAFQGEPYRTSWPLMAMGIFERAPQCWAPIDTLSSLAPPLPMVDDEGYYRWVERALLAIHDGDIYQVNLTMPFHLAFVGEPFALWQGIAQRTSSGYQAFVEDDDRTILSWSPELFLQLDGEGATMRPMKGTAALDRIDELANEKNRAENLMIVDMLRNDLHQICHDVRVTRMLDVEKYPTFATLTTELSGTMRPNRTVLDIFKATFPCGSVTGAPKRAAVQWIDRLERTSRDVYCGSIGYLSPERRGWWNVAIRTAQINASGCRFHAGGGIVADSDPQRERDEIDLKTDFLRLASTVELIESFANDATPAILAMHEQRIAMSARRLNVPLDIDRIHLQILQVLDRTHTSLAILRIRIGMHGSISIHSEPLDRPTDIRVALAPRRVKSDDPWLAIKSSWRQAHDDAARYATDLACFDAILCNERGELTEGSKTNLFVEREGVLLTPPTSVGLLPGILRASLLADARAATAILTAEELANSDAIYLGNSARGLMRARLVRA